MLKKSSLLFACTLLSQAPMLSYATSITIYNNNFAFITNPVSLDLKQGENKIKLSDITYQLEPDSVIIRDVDDKVALQILEQSYRNDPVTQFKLLKHFEGQTIQFKVDHVLADGSKVKKFVAGKVIRAGKNATRYSQSAETPIIDVAGQLQFSLPGEPVFPALADGNILKPELSWLLHADKKAKLNAELSYLSGGFSWYASYNLVDKGDDGFSLSAWITMDNQSGKDFDNAEVKFVAGDVVKPEPPVSKKRYRSQGLSFSSAPAQASVQQESLDEFHLYRLPRPLTLRDKETKQVEFIRVDGLKSTKRYVYDGALSKSSPGSYAKEAGFGQEFHKKVWVYREFDNSKANKLGIPLPKGSARFYLNRQNSLEFTGGNTIDHMAANERIKIFIGNAFDIVGERKQTDFVYDRKGKWITETVEIKLSNQKSEQVTVEVHEGLYRYANWKITDSTEKHLKADSKTVHFEVKLNPKEKKTLTYTVKYHW
jgi:hypothetical protein